MSLVAWYPLIDGSLENKGLDTTPLTLHGTIPFTNGRVRTAPTFSANNNNYYTMPPITKTNDFSVCLWFKLSSLRTNCLFWQQGSGNNGINIRYSSQNNDLLIAWGNISFRVKQNEIHENIWYHLCITTNDDGLLILYFNGENIQEKVNVSFNPLTDNYLIMGNTYNFVNPLDGQIQDFRYYDHCLSPKEVKEIAKGLCLHLPLKGTNARPNLFKNSATMFNGVGYNNTTASTWTKTLEFDENAPCGVNGKKVKIVFKRAEDDYTSFLGVFYNSATTGMPNLTLGATYCATVWARCTVPNVMLMTKVVQSQSIISKTDQTLTSEWRRYYFIFDALTETYTTCFYMQNVPVDVEGVFEVCCPKLELLSPTPYIPNVDDTQYSDYVLDYEPDCSGNEFDATKHGDLITSDSNGRYNTAVAFNGTNTYLQGLAPTNSECKEFTIATWVKLNNVIKSQTLYSCRKTVDSGISVFYIASQGFRLDDGVGNTIFANSTLEPNKWYHIAVTRDTNARKLYINGEFISSATTTGALVNMGTMYQVGESNAQTNTPLGNFLNAVLSDLRLYTSVLSIDDIKELYETSVSIDNDGNLYAYEFNEGFDQSIKKVGVMTSPEFTETTSVNMVKGNTNTTKLIEV